jgi:hypothetical protein
MRTLNSKDAVKSFPITSVCREDLLQAGFKREDIAKLDDDDMTYLASKMADAYMNVFWIDLGIIAEEIIERKTKKGV